MQPAVIDHDLAHTLRALRLVQIALLTCGVIGLAAAATGSVDADLAVVVPLVATVTACAAMSVEAVVRARLHAAHIAADGPRFGSITLLDLPLAVHMPAAPDDRPWTAIAVRHGVHSTNGSAEPELLVVRSGDAPTWMTIDRIAVPSGSIHEPD